MVSRTPHGVVDWRRRVLCYYAVHSLEDPPQQQLLDSIVGQSGANYIEQADAEGPSAQLGSTQLRQLKDEFLPDVICDDGSVLKSPRIDLYHLQDLSGSFTTHLKTLKKELPTLMVDIQEHYPGSRFGFGSYVDKPDKTLHGTANDYCYEVGQGLTHSVDKIKDILRDITTYHGGDNPESQLEAMSHAIYANPVGWSESDYDVDEDRPILRVLSLSTDDVYHQKGDREFKRAHNPFDYSTQACEENDYPSVEKLGKRLAESRVRPLFLTSTRPSFEAYSDLLERWAIYGVTGVVAELGRSSADIREQLLNSVKHIVCQPTPPPPATTPTPEPTRAPLPPIICPDGTVLPRPKVELYHLQDLSSSYGPFLENLKIKLPTLLDEISYRYPGSKFGTGSFVDKPIHEFGLPSDYCFKNHIQIVAHWEAVIEKVNEMKIFGGYDLPEATLEAMSYAANGHVAGFGTEDVDGEGREVARVLSVATDSTFHEATGMFGLVPHDPMYKGLEQCITHDYPTLKQVGEALAKRNIRVLFMISDAASDETVKVLSQKAAALQGMGVRVVLTPTSANASDIVEAITKGLDTAVCPPTTTSTTTEEPTNPMPTEEPTTEEPTNPMPTEEPTNPMPTEEPTNPMPTEEPTNPMPTAQPTAQPTGHPTTPDESLVTTTTKTGGGGGGASTGVIVGAAVGATAAIGAGAFATARLFTAETPSTQMDVVEVEDADVEGDVEREQTAAVQASYFE